ncbi:hypothetical protein [Halobacillus litoralis]|nr:hypothetical protein [Halobacillus litoralis]
MKKLIQKGIKYAKDNPEDAKRYAKKAYDTVKKYKDKQKPKK